MDIRRALGTPEEREQAVFSVPAHKHTTADFGRRVLLSLSTPARKNEAATLP